MAKKKVKGKAVSTAPSIEVWTVPTPIGDVTTNSPGMINQLFGQAWEKEKSVKCAKDESQ